MTTPSRSARSLAFVFGALAALGARPLAAYEYPSVEHGVKPERAFFVGDIDQIRLFAGGLSISIPIGQRFQVGPQLDYGFTLTYDNQIWDHIGSEVAGQPYTQAWPVKGANAGLGWRLSLGEYWDQNTIGPGACSNCYIAPDGARHQMAEELHPGSGNDGVRRYSNDSTYLRMRPIANGHAIDFPNGIVHEFDAAGRLVKMVDPFGNWVAVAHELDHWTVSDSHGRSHTVNTASAAYYDTKVTSVELDAFGGTTATYTFTYDDEPVPRSCLDDDPQTSATINVPFLVEVKLPPTAAGENATYSMPRQTAYNFASPGPCSNPGSGAPMEGLLLNVKLPTLGTVAWTHTLYAFPIPFNPEQQPEPTWLRVVAGVGSRTQLDAAGNTIGTWSYEQLPLDFGQEIEETITRVTTPLLDRTDHYFRAGQEIGPLYGLPFSDLEAAPGRPDLKRSTKVYECAANGTNCVLERTTYLKYAVDSLLPDFPEFNPRVEASYTRFHDDNRFAAVDYFDADGLGNFRGSLTSGDFPAGNTRTEYVNYNANSSIYPGSFSMPAATHWILGIYDYSWQSEGNVTAARTFDMEPETGLVRRARTHFTTIQGVPATGVNRQAPGGETAADLIVATTYDSSGFLTSERHYGGDLQNVPTTTPLSGLTLPASPVYRIDHETFYGTRATSTYFDVNSGQLMSFRALDCGVDPALPGSDPNIDKWTGLPNKCRDSSRIATSFEYDALGRVKWIKPESGQDAWTRFEYVAATSAEALARVNVYRRANGSETGTLLAESNLQFDALGRLWKEQRKTADGTFSTRETAYDGMGHVASVSQEGNVEKTTTYVGYDAFGRPSQIVYPDGHDSTFTYSGERETRRSVLVRDSDSQEHRAWTTEIRDRQGRLFQLLEPSEPNSNDTITTYFYDVGNRLARSQQSSASAGTQNRYFHYDQRGFLFKEQHPEKGGAGGNGFVFYDRYDARGHAGRRYECVLENCAVSDRKAHLTFTYDKAERLRTVTDENTSKLLKDFIYGTSNAAGVRTNGRLLTAKRYNYHLVPPGQPANDFTIRIEETYAYSGKAGRVSSRTTQLYSSTAANPTPVAGEGFSQTWTYDDLGNPKTIGYPDCTTGSCATFDSARTVTDNYTHGWLTSVTGFASSIAYHPNGMLKKISRSNGVSLTVGMDPDSMLRPRSFTTTGASPNWLSGDYAYDGAGNVTAIGNSSFIYDKVSRIKTAEVAAGTGLPFDDGFETGDLSCWAPGSCFGGGGAATQSYTYDAFGNLTNIAGNPGRATPTNAATNRLTDATFDVPGNLTAWNGDAYEYDALGVVTRRCPAGCTAGVPDFRYTYTADDERLWTIQVTAGAGAANTWTLRDLDGRTLREYEATAAWAARDYVYRGTELLASNFPGEGDRHFHVDHLGTPRLITNASKAAVAYHAYLPFGEEATAASQDLERRKFTGHERDTLGTADVSDDRDYMHARFCSPLTARFMSVDPVMQTKRAMGSPQLWNRYAYALNNPLKYVDPRGEDISVGLRFIGGKLSEDEKVQIIALVTRFWQERLDVGTVRVFDTANATESNKTLGFFRKMGTAELTIDSNLESLKHTANVVAAGTILSAQGLTMDQKLMAIANSANHEIFTHQLGAAMGGIVAEYGFRDLALSDRGLAQPTAARERFGTIVDSGLWLEERASMVRGPVPVHPDDAAAANRLLRGIRLLRPNPN